MSAFPPAADDPVLLRNLRVRLTVREPRALEEDLRDTPPAAITRALATLPPTVAGRVLESLPDAMRVQVATATDAAARARWQMRTETKPGTVGSLMREPLGVVPEEATAAEALELVRRAASAELTYLYAVDLAGRLSGVVVLRDLFLAAPESRVSAFMIQPAFFLTPDSTLLEAMHAVVGKHFPVYPVCTPEKILVGLVRGYVLFENQVITITAQAGKLVGVTASEHTDTSFSRSLRLRLPWLLVNLVMSLGSALVMLFFKATLAQFIILAVFLTVVTTQGRNSGAQTMALVLRGLTGGPWRESRRSTLLMKEVMLGVTGGAIVGLLAAAAIWLEEAWLGNPAAPIFAATVFVGMVLGCATSCAAGVAMPLMLRRLGFDPALAAGILLTNLCTVCCQVLFLSLAVWWLL